MTISFTSVAVIAVVAVLAPLAIGAARLPLPAVVLEILLGIAVGPQAFGWAQVDEPVAVLSTFGLAFSCSLPVSRSTSSGSAAGCSG